MKNKLLIIFIIFFTMGCNIGTQNDDRDREFRDYLESKYNIKLDDSSYVKKCHTDCEYFGFYTLDKDYNYVIQISNKASKMTDYYNNEAVEKRKELNKYIISFRGDSLAPHYLGYMSNTMSGGISYSSSEKTQLYYIVKYNNNMNFDDELAKDYQTLKKAQELLDNYAIKEMIIIYSDDSKLNDEDWILKLDIKDISDRSNIIFSPEKYNIKVKYSYRISNYKEDTRLSDKTFEEFKEMVYERLEKN